MRTFESLQELLDAEPGIGLGSSEWLEITQEMVDRFADATLDHQWIHVDVERAAQGPFGTTIVHGWMTVSLLPHLVGQTYAVPWAQQVLNVGTDKLRFVSPVPTGSRVRATTVLGEVEARGENAARVGFDVTVEVEGADRPALVARTLGQFFA